MPRKTGWRSRLHPRQEGFGVQIGRSAFSNEQTERGRSRNCSERLTHFEQDQPHICGGRRKDAWRASSSLGAEKRRSLRRGRARKGKCQPRGRGDRRAGEEERAESTHKKQGRGRKHPREGGGEGKWEEQRKTPRHGAEKSQGSSKERKQLREEIQGTPRPSEQETGSKPQVSARTKRGESKQEALPERARERERESEQKQEATQGQAKNKRERDQGARRAQV